MMSQSSPTDKSQNKESRLGPGPAGLRTFSNKRRCFYVSTVISLILGNGHGLRHSRFRAPPEAVRFPGVRRQSLEHEPYHPLLRPGCSALNEMQDTFCTRCSVCCSNACIYYTTLVPPVLRA